jgi:uncharacterized Tic20 family protein
MSHYEDAGSVLGTGGGEEVSLEERKWAFVAHLSAASGFIIPFGNIFGPLLIWQLKKSDMPFVADQAKEALNFQISACLATIACFVLFVAVIGIFLLPFVIFGALVFTVVAAVEANDGKSYRYPFNLRLIS